MSGRERALELFDLNFNSKINLLYEGFKGENGVLLYLLDNNGSTQSDISKFFNVSMPRVSKIINSLEEKGLIIRAISSDDKRKSIIIITDQGKEVIMLKKEKVLKVIEKILEVLTFEEFNSYKYISKKINSILNNNIVNFD